MEEVYLNGDLEQAKLAAQWYRDNFGPEGFFIEIQNHEGIPETERLNRGLVALARELEIGLVATNGSSIRPRGDISWQ